jgi:PII-like signaling protein
MTAPSTPPIIEVPEQAQRLMIYIGEDDRWHGLPLYEAIVRKARELHLAGATVLRGPMGFGADSRIHTTKILRLSEDLPIVIIIVDHADKIDAFRTQLAPMIGGGLVTIEDVRVLSYRTSQPQPGA